MGGGMGIGAVLVGAWGDHERLEVGRGMVGAVL